jgi:hypothetical protein
MLNSMGYNYLESVYIEPNYISVPDYLLSATALEEKND